MDFSRLYCIVDEQVCAMAEVEVSDLARFFISHGVPFLQYRNKLDFSGNIKNYDLFKKNVWLLRQLTWGTQTKFILNDYYKIAFDIDVDGVHLGQEDFEMLREEYGDNRPIQNMCEKYLLKERVGKKMMFGISTHTVEQAAEAKKCDVDYIGIGPVFTTPTKSSIQKIGLVQAKSMVEASQMPTVVIGGIDTDTYEEVLQCTQSKYFAMVRGCVSLYKEQANL